MDYGTGALKAALGVLACVGCATAVAADYPTKPIRFVVGVAPGGGTDFMARLVATRLAERTGQTVVVDNRPGATGLIGMEIVAKAPADGYTMIVFNVGHMMSAHLARKVAFDPVKDFAPVTLIANGTLLLGAHASLKMRTVNDLVAAAKAKPGSINYASGGSGGVQHLATELLKREAGIDLVHVPYKGSGPGVVALLAGEVQLFLTNISPLLPHMRAGRVQALALTGDKRNPAAPDVPTFAQAGYPTVDVSLWQGIFAPANTPPQVLDKVSREVAAIVRTPEVTALMAKQGAEPAGHSVAEFSAFVARERDKWLRVARESGILKR